MRGGGILDPEARAKAAAIVWWDFFGDGVGHLPHLDALMEGAEDSTATPSDVAAALVAVGYPAEVAEARASDRGRQAILNEDDEKPDSRRAAGSKGVFCAMCELAIDDLVALSVKGVLLPDWTIRPDWPPRNHNGVVGYMGRSEVQDLLDWFFKGPFEAEMASMGVGHDLGQVVAAVEAKIAKERAKAAAEAERKAKASEEPRRVA